MSLLQKWAQAIDDSDVNVMSELLHDDFEFTLHSAGKILSKQDVIDWVASDENEYVKKAIEFSADPEMLTDINKNLRRRALKSPLFNSALFAKQLNNVFWDMWNNFILKM